MLTILAVSAYVVASLANGTAAQIPDEALLVAEAVGAEAPVDAGGAQHPVFARLGDANLVLPIPAQDVTIIAYHSLSDERAVPLEPMGSQLNADLVSRGLQRVFAGDEPIRYYEIESSGRAVTEHGAVDIGAPAGTPILSPITGVVTAITAYKLYGKYDDVQIDISPQGLSGMIVSLLFVDEPSVTIGQPVEQGKTQLGKVRPVQGDLGARLTEYTHDSGTHVQLQVTQSVPQ